MTTFYDWYDVTAPYCSSNLDNQIHFRCPLYSRANEFYLPSNIVPFVSTLLDSIQLPPKLSRNSYTRPFAQHSTSPRSPSGDSFSPLSVMYIDPPYLTQLYSVPANQASARASQSVFETNSEYWSPSDLALFQNKFGLPLVPAKAINGHTTSTCATAGSTPTSSTPSCNEGNLDIQYLVGLAPSISSSVFYVPPGSDPFHSWVVTVSSMKDPPLVNSISWGAIEQYMSPSSLSSFSTEALKLSLMGVSIVVASGDDGVANRNSGTCLCSADSSSSWLAWSNSLSSQGNPGWKGSGYFPNFPATCPYVTAVGATMGPETSQPEVNCQSNKGGVITTGGGFSTYYSTPSWQTEALSGYFTLINNPSSGYLTPKPGYNPRGRAIPDVSLIGVDYFVFLGGKPALVFGTSASAPVFAAFLTLINSERLHQNKTSLGFVNPSLYYFGLNQTLGAGLFIDVTSGDNSCCSNPDYPNVASTCCSSGFRTSPGWDPVTGWGSVNVEKLFSLLTDSELEFYEPTFQPTTAPPNLFHLNDHLVLVLGIIVVLLAALLFGGSSLYFHCNRTSGPEGWGSGRNEQTTRSNSPGGAEIVVGEGLELTEIALDPIANQDMRHEGGKGGGGDMSSSDSNPSGLRGWLSRIHRGVNLGQGWDRVSRERIGDSSTGTGNWSRVIEKEETWEGFEIEVSDSLPSSSPSDCPVHIFQGVLSEDTNQTHQIHP